PSIGHHGGKCAHVADLDAVVAFDGSGGDGRGDHGSVGAVDGEGAAQRVSDGLECGLERGELAAEGGDLGALAGERALLIVEQRDGQAGDVDSSSNEVLKVLRVGATAGEDRIGGAAHTNAPVGPDCSGTGGWQ